MLNLRKLFQAEPTIGELIADSLLNEHDDWRCDYGDYVNGRRGLKVSIRTWRMLIGVSVQGVPITAGEKRKILRAAQLWNETESERRRQKAHLRFVQGVPVSG